MPRDGRPPDNDVTRAGSLAPIRVSPEERTAIEDAAAQLGLKVAEYVRTAPERDDAVRLFLAGAVTREGLREIFE